MRFIYNILFNVGLLLSAPFYFLKMWRRGSWQAGFGQRFGKYDSKVKQAITNRHVLWIHAVSVGEANICMQLISALETRVPNLKIVVSTTTSTGMQELRKKLPSHIEKIYYPIDRKKYVNRAVSTFHPEAVILVEAEIWPNFLWKCFNQNTPVFLVNARISDRSFRGYRRFGFLFRPLFAGMSGIGCQNESDRKKLLELGAVSDRVHVVGNLKFDSAATGANKRLDARNLLDQMGVDPKSQIIIGASTHPGEEVLLAEVFMKLRKFFPQLFLILVPRHFERSRSVGVELEACGIAFMYRTEIKPQAGNRAAPPPCLLVNTTGELTAFYREADIVFVGKSLCAHGGQNPIEAASLGKAVIFGPHMENFKPVVDLFLAEKGALQVQSKEELEAVISRLISNKEERIELAKKGLELVRKNMGGMERTLEIILPILERSEVYVAPEP